MEKVSLLFFFFLKRNLHCTPTLECKVSLQEDIDPFYITTQKYLKKTEPLAIVNSRYVKFYISFFIKSFRCVTLILWIRTWYQYDSSYQKLSIPAREDDNPLWDKRKFLKF